MIVSYLVKTLTRNSSVDNDRRDFIPGGALNKGQLKRFLDGYLNFAYVQVQIDLDIQEDYLVAIFDLLTLLSVLVSRQDFEVYGRGRFVLELDPIACFFIFRTSLLRTEIRLGVHVEYLNLGTILDVLALAPLDQLAVRVLLILHLLFQ